MVQTEEKARSIAWVEKAKVGNRYAMEQLASLYQEDIFRMVYYRTHSAMDAEDITQEVFIQAFNNLSGLKSADRFKSWLFTIAVNKVRDFHRKKRFQNLFGSFSDTKEKDMQANPEIPENPEVLEDLMKQDFWKQVKLLLEILPRMEREVFTLRFMDHLSIKEISSVMKKGESTVKTHLYRALKKFRKEPSMLAFLKEGTT